MTRDVCDAQCLVHAAWCRLNDAMREREDYDEDLQALHKLMERATKESCQFRKRLCFALPRRPGGM